jgi:hypothetical protein
MDRIAAMIESKIVAPKPFNKNEYYCSLAWLLDR